MAVSEPFQFDLESIPTITVGQYGCCLTSTVKALRIWNSVCAVVGVQETWHAMTRYGWQGSSSSFVSWYNEWGRHQYVFCEALRQLLLHTPQIRMNNNPMSLNTCLAYVEDRGFTTEAKSRILIDPECLDEALHTTTPDFQRILPVVDDQVLNTRLAAKKPGHTLLGDALSMLLLQPSVHMDLESNIALLISRAHFDGSGLCITDTANHAAMIFHQNQWLTPVQFLTTLIRRVQDAGGANAYAIQFAYSRSRVLRHIELMPNLLKELQQREAAVIRYRTALPPTLWTILGGNEHLPLPLLPVRALVDMCHAYLDYS